MSKVTIIGAGNVGGALALGWAKAGHEVIIGARNPDSEKVKKVISQNSEIKLNSIEEALKKSGVILISANPSSIEEIAEKLTDVKDKLITINHVQNELIQANRFKRNYDIFKNSLISNPTFAIPQTTLFF